MAVYSALSPFSVGNRDKAVYCADDLYVSFKVNVAIAWSFKSRAGLPNN